MCVGAWRYLRRHSKAYAGTRPKIITRMKVPTSYASDSSMPNVCSMLPEKYQKRTTGRLATVTHGSSSDFSRPCPTSDLQPQLCDYGSLHYAHALELCGYDSLYYAHALELCGYGSLYYAHALELCGYGSLYYAHALELCGYGSLYYAHALGPPGGVQFVTSFLLAKKLRLKGEKKTVSTQVVDTTCRDTGAVDATCRDTGAVDATCRDTGAVDVGTADTVHAPVQTNMQR